MEDKKRNWGKASLITLGIDTLILFVMTITWGDLANKFKAIYDQFNVELPLITQFSLTGYKVFFVLLMIGLLSKEFLKNKKTTFIINITTLVVVLLLFSILGSLGMLLPLFGLISLGQ